MFTLSPVWRSFLFGFLGAVLAVLVCLLAIRLYHDDQFIQALARQLQANAQQQQQQQPLQVQPGQAAPPVVTPPAK